MVKEIVQDNNWQRPIYFAVTCSEDSKIGLQDYLKMEGMSFRLVPEKKKPGIEFLNQEIMEKELKENPGFSKTYLPGFKFRGLNDPKIFFDDNHVRMTQNYRNAFMRLAIYYINTQNDQQAAATLDEMQKKIPREIIPMDFEILFEIGNMYFTIGAMKQYKEIAGDVEKEALKKLEVNPGDVQSYYNPYRILIDIYDNLKDYKKLLGIWQRLGTMYPNDVNVKANITKYENLVKTGGVPVDTVHSPDSVK
jgi:tetratricopeptide (TPR) repeat protein